MGQLILLCLVLLAPQQPASSERTLTLILGQDSTSIEVVTESEAGRAYDELSQKQALTADENRRLVALALALGTLPDYRALMLPSPRNTREFLDNEIRRGVRRPAQGGR